MEISRDDDGESDGDIRDSKVALSSGRIRHAF